MNNPPPQNPNSRNPREDPFAGRDNTYFPSRNPSSPPPNYSQIQTQYRHFAKKETGIQFLGSLFILISFLIEFIVFLLINNIRTRLNLSFREIAFRFGSFFIILAGITVLALIQFLIIRKWNVSIVHGSGYLARSNYQLINQIRRLKNLIIGIICACVFYLRRIMKSQFPRVPQYARIILFYRFLLFISWILVLSYLILEIIQLVKWSRRLKAIQRMEEKIIAELPHLDELTRLSEIEENFDDENEDTPTHF